MKRNLFGFKEADAVFNATRTHRYSLMRAWDDTGASILWVMLNPSTADENKLDPTLRRCRNFSREWGYGSFYVANIYAFRATNPAELFKAENPIGENNDEWIRRLAARCQTVVAGWGSHPMVKNSDRAKRVLEMLAKFRSIYCLGTTQDGFPRHPLYVPMTQELELLKEKGRVV